MSPTPSASQPTAAFDAWLPLALADPAGYAYGEARNALVEAVRADRDGPLTRHLLSQCTHPDPEVRRLVLHLLTDLCGTGGSWPEAADQAVSRLRDPAPEVRRSAAWLLTAARFEQAYHFVRSRQQGLAPDARLALTEAVFSWTRPVTPDELLALADKLRDDPDPAVQLLAAMAGLALAPEDQWSGWEELAVRCLPIAAARLGRSGSWLRVRVGRLWYLALVRRDREEAAYAWTARLLAHDSPVARLAGLDLARGALGMWRAAPDRLAIRLAAAADDTNDAVRTEAVRVISVCLETSRRCAEQLARALGDQELRTGAAIALARIGDRRAAGTVLAALRAASAERGLPEAAAALARQSQSRVQDESQGQSQGRSQDHDQSQDPAPDRWVEAAAEALAAAPDTCPPGLNTHRGCSLAGALCVAVALGPAAAALVPQLLDLLSGPAPHPDSCRRWAQGQAYAALAAIGPAAAAAVPALLRQEAAAAYPHSAALALSAITGEREHAEACLDRHQATARLGGPVLDLMEWLTEHGGLADRHAARLTAVTRRPRHIYPRTLHLLWRLRGPAVAALVLETIPGYLTDDLFGPPACRLLAEMGSLAQPTIAELEEIVDRRTRIGMYIGDEDEELRADERLTEAAALALARLTATSPGGDPSS